MKMTSHEQAKREAIRKRAKRQGYRLHKGPNADNPYMLSNATTCMTFSDLDEVMDELRARREPRQRRAA
jgi:hypothetical protein